MSNTLVLSNSIAKQCSWPDYLVFLWLPPLQQPSTPPPPLSRHNDSPVFGQFLALWPLVIKLKMYEIGHPFWFVLSVFLLFNNPARTCLQKLDYKICSISAVILAVIGGHTRSHFHISYCLYKSKLLNYKFAITCIQMPTKKKQKSNFPKHGGWTCIVLIYRYQYFNYKNQT